MQKWGADGYFISNGPGDPEVMNYAVDTIKKILAIGNLVWHLSRKSTTSKGSGYKHL